MRIAVSREKNRIIVAAVFVAAVLLITWLFFTIHFETNDDGSIIQTLAGYRTGTPYPGTIFTNVLFGYIVSFLYQVCGSIPWYTILFLLLLFLSCMVILKSMLKLGNRFKVHLWIILSFYSVIHVVAILYYSIFLQFTFMSAITGVAAGSIYWAFEPDDSKHVQKADRILFVVLILFSLIIRPLSGYLSLLFLLLMIVFKLVKNRALIRKWFSATSAFYLIIGAVLFGSLLCNFIYENTHSGWKEFREYHEWRAYYTDYPHPVWGDAEEIYESIGWSEPFHDIVEEWYFMDKRISKDAFQTIGEYSKTQWQTKQLTVPERASQAIRRFMQTSKESHLYGAYLILLLLAVWGIVRFVSRRQYIGAIWLGGIYLLYYAVSLYFCYAGRYPQRVAYSILLPVTVLVIFFVLQTLKTDRFRISEFSRLTILIPVLAATFFLLFHSIIFISNSEPYYSKDNQIRTSMEKYCIENPDKIYVYDKTLALPSDPFVTYPNEKPFNWVFYGGSTMYSPPYYEQINALGMESFYTEDLFNENVYFMYNSEAQIDTSPLYIFLMIEYNNIGYEKVFAGKDGFDVYKFFRI